MCSSDLGEGKTMDEAMEAVNQVVEGVYSAKAAKLLSEKYDVSMPLVSEVNKVLFDNKSVRESLEDLMIRDKTTEIAVENWK